MAEENKMDANNALIDFIITHSKNHNKYKPYVKGAKTRREARNRLIQNLDDMDDDEREKFIKGALVRYNEKLGENEPKFTRNSIDLSLMKKLPINVSEWSREDVDDANKSIAQALGYGDLLDDKKEDVKNGLDRMYNELFNGDDRLPVLGQFTNDHAPWFRSVGYNPTESGEKKLAEKIRSHVTNDKGEIIPKKLMELRDALGYLSNGDKDDTLEDIIGDVTSKVRRGFDMRTRDIKDPVNGYGLNTLTKTAETLLLGQIANSWDKGKNAEWSDAGIDASFMALPFMKGYGIGVNAMGKITPLLSKLPSKAQYALGAAGSATKGAGSGALYGLLTAVNDRHKEGLGTEIYHGDDLEGSTAQHVPETDMADITSMALKYGLRGAMLGGGLGSLQVLVKTARGGRGAALLKFLNQESEDLHRLGGKPYKHTPIVKESDALNEALGRASKDLQKEYQAVGKALDTPSAGRTNKQNMLVEIAKEKGGKNGGAYGYLNQVDKASKTLEKGVKSADGNFYLGKEELSALKRLLNDKNTPPNVKETIIKALEKGGGIKEYTQGNMFLDALLGQVKRNGVYNRDGQLKYYDAVPIIRNIMFNN